MSVYKDAVRLHNKEKKSHHIPNAIILPAEQLRFCRQLQNLESSIGSGLFRHVTHKLNPLAALFYFKRAYTA